LLKKLTNKLHLTNFEQIRQYLFDVNWL